MFIQEHKIRPMEGEFAREFRKHLHRIWAGELTPEELARKRLGEQRVKMNSAIWD